MQIGVALQKEVFKKEFHYKKEVLNLESQKKEVFKKE